MPDKDGNLLPPLPEDVFDGHKESTELNFTKCNHKMVKYLNNSLQCTCGAGWSGPEIHKLYKALTQ